MATVTENVSNDQLLKELKNVTAELAQIKKDVAQIGTELHLVHEDVKNLPTGVKWAEEPR
jgi:hypothetical protein